MTKIDNTASSRTWFITGATSGIGRELTTAALERGDQVAAIARRIGALSDLHARFPETLLPLVANVSDEQAVRNAVKQTTTRFGRIDIVANNAGC